MRVVRSLCCAADKLAVVHGLLKSEYSTILNLEASADQQMRAERLVQLCTTGSEHLGRAYTAFLESGSDASALLTALQVSDGQPELFSSYPQRSHRSTA